MSRGNSAGTVGLDIVYVNCFVIENGFIVENGFSWFYPYCGQCSVVLKMACLRLVKLVDREKSTCLIEFPKGRVRNLSTFSLVNLGREEYVSYRLS